MHEDQRVDAKTIAGRVVMLKDRGYTPKQIALEEKIAVGRVTEILRRAKSNTHTARQITEIHEMTMEILAILRDLKKIDPVRIAASMRRLETRDLARKVGESVTNRS